MPPKPPATHNFMSTKIDILHPVFIKWFKSTFPQCKNVVVIDDENTLFATVNGRRVCYKHLINDVLVGLKRLKPKVVTVMYSNRMIEDMNIDRQLFPDVFSQFDLIISADNFTQPLLKSFCEQRALKGQPFLLQLRRVSKPVSEIFDDLPVVLIDDEVGSDWLAVKEGLHGIKTYTYKQDKPENSKLMLKKLVRQITSQ